MLYSRERQNLPLIELYARSRRKQGIQERMGITVSRSDDESEVLVSIEGRFDFHLHADFKGVYDNLPPNTHFIIDLLKTTFLDSSAMGMLLLLREHVGGDAGKIQIINSKPEVRKALAISNLDKLFTVS